MNKKGFTLVELLAVIAILAILVIIALPNVMSMFKTAKKNSFTTEVKKIAQTAEQQWISDSMFETNEKVYARCKSGCVNGLELSGRTELDYYIRLNKAGKIVRYYATDGTYQYEYTGEELKIEEVSGVTEVSELQETEKIEISSNTVTKGETVVTSSNEESNTAVSFANDSWATIASNVRNNRGHLYEVGSTRQIDLGSFGTHTLRVANTSTPGECSTSGFSQSACGFVIEFEDIITTHIMNPYDSSNTTTNGINNKGGWEYSDMRAFINSGKYLAGTANEIDYTSSGIYNSLPSDLKNIIINTTVVSGYGRGDSNNYTTTDKLYLLSTHEVWEDVDGNTSSGIDYLDKAYIYTRQLDYYKSKNVTTNNYSNAIKRSNGIASTIWWLRSSYFTNFFCFHYVANIGGNVFNISYKTHGVSPAFRIG